MTKNQLTKIKQEYIEYWLIYLYKQRQIKFELWRMSSDKIKDIFEYIKNNGNFLSSQKVLKQVNLHQEITWELIVKLCSKLKNKNIENAYAQIFFMINDPDKHQRSSKWLKQYMDIRDLAIKLGTTYSVYDYFRPQKDKIINLLHKIIEVSKGVNKIKSELDSLITKDDLMTKELNKNRLLEESTKLQLQELKERKQKERPIYDQILSNCDTINQNINSKRQQKLDLISKQKSIKDEINRFQKGLEDFRYQNEEKLIQIQSLKKQIAQNAPQVKKQKRAVQQEYQRLEKQIHAEIQFTKKRQNKIQQSLQDRKIFKDQIIDLINQLVDSFNFLEQGKAKQFKAKQEYDLYKKRRALQTSQQDQIKDVIRDLQIQHINQNSLCESLQKERKRNQSEYRALMAKDTKIKEDIRVIKERLKKFKEINEAFKQSMQITKQRHEQKYIQLENRRKTWEQQITKSLVQIYNPLHELRFD